MARLSILVVILFIGPCVPASHQHLRHHTEDGVHLFKQGSYADARDCFKAALALKPNDPDLLYNLGQCHARMGQHDQAESLYKECLRHNSDHGDARHAWLLLLINSDRAGEGRRMIESWRQSRPQIAGPHVEEAWLRARDGDLDDARRFYQRALDLEPRHPRALVELAGVYEKLGRPERALVLYERALVAEPNQPAVARLVSEMRKRGVGRPHPD
jgi:tetratricopeptide (TPR) repeat protein